MERFGEYDLLRKLATGGMAQVFLARRRGAEGFEKLCVVKRILPHLAENPEFVEMFLREARLAARLDHPNVVHVFDLGRVGNSLFLAMEYVDGEDFRRVERQAGVVGRIPVPLSLRMVAGACAGLEFAHNLADAAGRTLGVVHRDVSPQNLLVTFDGTVKVIDFGIAKAIDGVALTEPGMLKGKYPYMSPEQASGLELDRRSDVFALGIVLHELLTGMRLFKRESDLATLHAVLACSVPRPSESNLNVDATLDDIVMGALAKDRDRRTPTAGKLLEQLEDYIQSRRLPGLQHHLRQFMSELYADRLEERTRAGRPWYLDAAEEPSRAKAAPAEPKTEAAREPPTLSHTPTQPKPVQPASKPPGRARKLGLAFLFAAVVAGAIAYFVDSDNSPQGAKPPTTPSGSTEAKAAPSSAPAPAIVNQAPAAPPPVAAPALRVGPFAAPPPRAAPASAPKLSPELQRIRDAHRLMAPRAESRDAKPAAAAVPPAGDPSAPAPRKALEKPKDPLHDRSGTEDW